MAIHFEEPKATAMSQKISARNNNPIMPMNLLCKILFPSLDRWQRRRQLKMILIGTLTGLLLAGLIVMMMVMKNHSYK